jgi:hypothetical protein
MPVHVHLCRASRGSEASCEMRRVDASCLLGVLIAPLTTKGSTNFSGPRLPELSGRFQPMQSYHIAYFYTITSGRQAQKLWSDTWKQFSAARKRVRSPRLQIHGMTLGENRCANVPRLTARFRARCAAPRRQRDAQNSGRYKCNAVTAGRSRKRRESSRQLITASPRELAVWNPVCPPTLPTCRKW